MKLPKLSATLVLLAVSASIFAHPGHGKHGLAAGLAHPSAGLDHLLAVSAVGLWATQQQEIVRLVLPCAFVGAMLAGRLLGFEGLQLPLMEIGVAVSVFIPSLCTVLTVHLPLVLMMAVTVLFALAHGVAHGLELPGPSSPWPCAFGLVVTTVVLHAAGYALVHFLLRVITPLVRLVGLASAGVGVWLPAG